MMFSGIVRALGSVLAQEKGGGKLRIRVGTEAAFLEQTSAGDSVAVNGVCLTITEKDGCAFAADVSNATLACTTLGQLQEGNRVNLENALCLGDSLDGHLVTGHVDAVGEILTITRDNCNMQIQIKAPLNVMTMIAPKGSVCVDGVSLTVNAVNDLGFEVNIIPYTIEKTTFSSLKKGSPVNLEVDLIARYTARLLEARQG